MIGAFPLFTNHDRAWKTATSRSHDQTSPWRKTIIQASERYIVSGYNCIAEKQGGPVHRRPPETATTVLVCCCVLPSPIFRETALVEE